MSFQKPMDGTKIDPSKIFYGCSRLHVARVETRLKVARFCRTGVPRSNFSAELEAESEVHRLAAAVHPAEGSPLPVPVRFGHLEDHPRDLAASSARRSPRWAAPRISTIFDRRPASLGISVAADIRPDIASNGCRTCPRERFRLRRRCTELFARISYVLHDILV